MGLDEPEWFASVNLIFAWNVNNKAEIPDTDCRNPCEI